MRIIRIIPRLLAVLLTAVLVCGGLLSLPVSAEEEKSFSVDATELDGVGDDDNGDGMIFLFEGSGKSARVVSSEEHNLRYMYILVFDRYGSCVQIGNNLVFASVDPAFQNFVVIPQSGFMVTFYYNSGFPKNVALYEYYRSLEGALSGKTEDIYNRTLEIESDYSASYKNMTVTLTYGTEGTVIRDCTDTDPEGTGDPSEDSAPPAADDPPEDIPEGAVAAKITGEDVPFANVNGGVTVARNETSVDEEYLSDDWNLRYAYILVFGKDGVCTEIGNNLVYASVDRSYQNAVKVPAGGFLAAFSYNAESEKNRPLFDLYEEALAGGTIYNSTIPPVNGVRAYIEDGYLVAWIENVDEPAESSEEPPAESSEEPPAESSEEPPAESSGEPAGEASPEPSAEPSADTEPSETAETSAKEPSESFSGSGPEEQEKDKEIGKASAGGLPPAVIVLIVAAGVAAVAAVVTVIAVRRKPKKQ